MEQKGIEIKNQQATGTEGGLKSKACQSDQEICSPHAMRGGNADRLCTALD